MGQIWRGDQGIGGQSFSNTATNRDCICFSLNWKWGLLSGSDEAAWPRVQGCEPRSVVWKQKYHHYTREFISLVCCPFLCENYDFNHLFTKCLKKFLQFFAMNTSMRNVCWTIAVVVFGESHALFDIMNNVYFKHADNFLPILSVFCAFPSKHVREYFLIYRLKRCVQST